MAKTSVSPIQQLIVDHLPATGGMVLREFSASLPAEERKQAQGQIQELKLKGVIATWLVVGEDGKATTYIGLAANKPPKL